MKKLNHDQMLELINQEFLINMESMPKFTKKHKKFLIEKISELLNHTSELLERIRIKNVVSGLNYIKTKGDQFIGISIDLDEFNKLKKGDIVTCLQVGSYHKDWFTVGKEYKIIASKVFGNYIRDNQGSKNQNISGSSYFSIKRTSKTKG
tara:strand:+ start:634 stop:1083 length:450 start_codon:yes stop_codon:yes gene_type:complete